MCLNNVFFKIFCFSSYFIQNFIINLYFEVLILSSGLKSVYGFESSYIISVKLENTKYLYENERRRGEHSGDKAVRA